MMASNTTTYKGFEVFEFDTPKNQDVIYSTVSEVGKTLGYSVSSLDKRKRVIGLTKDAGLFIGVMVGKIEKSIVQFSIKNGGRTIEVEILVVGNFDTGGSEAANRILDQFESGLKRRMPS